MRSKLLTVFMAVAVVVALAAEFSVAAVAYQGNANKPAAPAKPRAKRPRPHRPATHAAAMPTTPQDCLNRLATLAAREPLPAYDGEPMRIINDGLLWANGKCAVTDQAQRLKITNLANQWRMNHASEVQTALRDLGATASASSDMGSTPRTPRSPRGRRTPAAATPATGDTQATPPSSDTTQAAPPSDETGAATNSNTRRHTPRRRAPRRNANTANTNS